MSIKAINFAWRVIPVSDLKPASVIVLLALAHCHFEDTGRCDPSIAFLCKKTGLSDRGVRSAIGDLHKKDILHVTHRQAKTGRGRRDLTNRYAFRMGAGFAGTRGQDLHPLKDMARKLPSSLESLIHGVEDFQIEDCTDGGQGDA